MRPAGASCKDCTFFEGQDGKQGFCMKNTPYMQFVPLPHQNFQTGQVEMRVQAYCGHPTTLETGWCGEYSKQISIMH